MTHHLPPYDLQVSKKAGRVYVLDPIRKKEILLSPEEFIRQHLIQHLMQAMEVPRTQIMVEEGTKVQARFGRTDVVVRDSQGNTLLLVECKRPEAHLDQKVLDQAHRYNMELDAPFIGICAGAGMMLACVSKDPPQLVLLNQLPNYTQMLQAAQRGEPCKSLVQN